MKRRSLLRAAAGTVPAAALAGCVDTLMNLQLSTPVTMNLENDTDTERNVVITAYEVDTDRQTYDESVSVPTEGTANLAHLSNAEQQVTLELFGLGETGEPVHEVSTFIDEDTQSLHGIVTADGLVLEISTRGAEDVRRNGSAVEVEGEDSGASEDADANGDDGADSENRSDGS